MILSVWAPRAKSVELVVADARFPMRTDAHGHWLAELDPAGLRGGYRYSIDGGSPLPDPRSRWQPQGVHGASHVLDSAPLRPALPPPFQQKPLGEALIYEMHVGTFTPAGTYAGAVERLSHLTSLGVTHVELMPLATFPGRRGWGYDGVDLYAPFGGYGTPQELAQFIDACHAHGLAVLLDVVYNHLGPDGNYLAAFAPYFTDRVRTPWGEAINYDEADSDEVRHFVIDNALMWLGEYGFDGLRLDAVHAIYSFEATHILEELSTAVHRLGAALNRAFVLIAESDLNDPRLVRSQARGGFELDAHWADDFHHAIHRYFTGETRGYYQDFNGIADIAAALSRGYVYRGQYSAFRRRRHGRNPSGVRPDQLVVFAQNHDQIGNRACGERLSMLLDSTQLKAIAAMTLLSPFVPMLFQGEEWGASTPFLYFTDHEDPTLARLVSEGRAREFASFGWAGAVPDPQAADTFERSKLDWSEITEPSHAELLDWHRQLIKLRAQHRNASAKPKVKFDARSGWLRFEHADIAVLFNFAAASQRVALPAGSWELVLSSQPDDDVEAAALPGRATRIYRRA